MNDWRDTRRFAAIDWRSTVSIIDSRDWGQRDGYQITAAVIYDEETRITDHETYANDPEVVSAWRLDLWTFVSVVVTASVNGIELGTARQNGVEYGVLPVAGQESKFLDPLDEPLENWDQLIGEAVAEADEKITALIAAVAETDKRATALVAARGPSITFADSDGLTSVLSYANKGLATRGWTRDGDGLTYDFHLADGRVITGTFYTDRWNGDTQVVTIATHDFGNPDGDKVEVPLADIVRVVYC